MNGTELFHHTFSNPEIGLTRSRSATLLDNGMVRLWEHSELEGRDGHAGTIADTEDYWSLDELTQIVAAAKAAGRA